MTQDSFYFTAESYKNQTGIKMDRKKAAAVLPYVEDVSQSLRHCL